LAKERGSIVWTARKLGIGDNSLQHWKRQMQNAPERPFPGNGNPSDAEMAHILIREGIAIPPLIGRMSTGVRHFTFQRTI